MLSLPRKERIAISMCHCKCTAIHRPHSTCRAAICIFLMICEIAALIYHPTNITLLHRNDIATQSHTPGVSILILPHLIRRAISHPDKVILQAIRYYYLIILSAMPLSARTWLYNTAIFLSFGASFNKPVAEPFTRTFLRVMATTGFNLFDHDL